MANINPGLSGTFKQRSLEGRLLEILMFTVLCEKDDAVNPENRHTVTAAFDADQNVFRGTYAIPADEVADGDGNILLKAKSHLQGLDIDPGLDNPTFKSKRPEAYLLEVLKRVQLLEKNPAKNAKGVKRITGKYDSDREMYEGSFDIPVQLGLASDGSIVIFAVPYLDI